MPVRHTSEQCQGKRSGLTPLSVCGCKKACPIAREKRKKIFAPQRGLSGARNGCPILDHSPQVLKACLLKGCRLIALQLLPHSVHDANPDIVEDTHSDAVAFPFLASTLIVLQIPALGLSHLLGELVQDIAQRFEAGMASMNAAVDSTLEDDRRGSRQHLQAGSISIAVVVIANFGRASEEPDACQLAADSQRSRGLRDSKKGVQFLYHRRRFGPSRDLVGDELRLVQALKDLWSHFLSYGMTSLLEDLGDLRDLGCLSSIQGRIDPQKGQGRALLKFTEEVEDDRIVGFEAGRELFHQAGLHLNQGILVTSEDFEFCNRLAVGLQMVQLCEVRPSRPGQQIRINSVLFGFRSCSLAINGGGMDKVNRPVVLQQEGDEQSRRGFDNTSHAFLPIRAAEGFQEQMQLLQSLGCVLHLHWCFHLTTRVVDDEDTMMGITSIDACIKHRPFLFFRKHSWGKRVRILWCSSKTQSPNNRFAQKHGHRSGDFLNRSKPRRIQMRSLACSVHDLSKQSVCSDPLSRGSVYILLDM